MADVSACNTRCRKALRRTFLAPQRRAVHRLAHDLQDKLDRVFDRDVLLVLLLEQRRRRAVVRADTCRLPARVVPRRVGVVELELVMWVVTGIEERYTKWPKTCARIRDVQPSRGHPGRLRGDAPPYCVYPCLRSHSRWARSSTGISSLYMNRCRCAACRA